MYTLYFLGLIMTFIPIFLFFISIMLGNKLDFDREKLSPFECGFDPIKSARIPFSLRFFLLL